jgi:hypothetical protein
MAYLLSICRQMTSLDFSLRYKRRQERYTAGVKNGRGEERDWMPNREPGIKIQSVWMGALLVDQSVLLAAATKLSGCATGFAARAISSTDAGKGSCRGRPLLGGGLVMERIFRPLAAQARRRSTQA